MTTPRSLVRLLLLILVAVSATSCQATGSTAEIGMTLHFRGADAAAIKRQFELMAAMGVTWVRVDVDWSVIETERGQPDWSAPDLLIDEAASHQMKVLAVLAFSPAWASAGGHSADASHAQRPSRLSDYAAFARTAASRYAPRGVHSWEIWNEPNTAKFWPPSPDAGEYGRLFRAAADAIRGVDAHATLLIGGLSPQYEVPGSDVAPASYLEQLYDDGAAQLADGLAVHPYTFPSLPMDSFQRTTGGFRDLPELHAMMEKRGDGRKKLWITEFGAPTGTGPSAVTEQYQAAILLQARREIDGWDWAGPLIYYELVDGGTRRADIEQNFGVLRADNTPKLAARALMDTTRR
ncbi:beta-galactosidase [Mycolicibacterium chubuense NBB4]|uniref:Beta-galactosidase n=1 Tax=Mycolicibacterium chubuense (strain NBB4) TaxID=710421 RepID=I4BFN1_MYCCN|nr:cellulase family glycosylhydrolase [Mycolicibacterium chubuense]AFM16088.1 beta-galactosidase [Mycolicibacterium chubuense NBB4]